MPRRPHAKLSPSGSERWLSCPGSISLSEKLPPPMPSEFADEGTAAHDLAAAALRENKLCLEYLGQDFNGIKVDGDMAEHVQSYVDYCRSFMAPGWIYGIEEEFDLGVFVPGCFGSTDFWAFNEKEKHLVVVDLKYGKGVVVDPYQNSQLMMYGLGALVRLTTQKFPKQVSSPSNDLVKTVSLTIVQPRAYHEEGPVRGWDTRGVDLLFWARAVLMPGAVATENPHPRFECGDHCRFCNGLPLCPEYAKQALAIARTNFEDPVLPSPESLTPEQIVKVLKAADLLNVWAKQVQAYAQYKLENGEELPGYKLVAKKSNRKWVDLESVVPVLEKYLGDDAYTKELLSIAAAEKELKRRGLSADAVLAGLYEKPDAGVIIAPESDKRPAVQASTSTRAGFLTDADFLE